MDASDTFELFDRGIRRGLDAGESVSEALRPGDNKTSSEMSSVAADSRRLKRAPIGVRVGVTAGACTVTFGGPTTSEVSSDEASLFDLRLRANRGDEPALLVWNN